MKRLVVLVFLAVMLSTIIMTLAVLRPSITAHASDGSIVLCLNTPPNATHDCPAVMNQSTDSIDNSITCFINATDGDGNGINYTPYTLSGIVISINEGNVTLNATQNAVGNQSLLINITDNSSCSNDVYPLNYTFEVLDLNDPPEYFLTIPDVNFTSGTSSSPFTLYDFFRDPDNDTLNFTVLGDNIITVTITQSNGNILFTSSGCGTDYLIFEATDPSNLSASSSIVEVTSNCATQSSSSGSSSGSGGGGGSSSTYICNSEWSCEEWATCLINDSQRKRCVDLRSCKTEYVRYFWRSCDYIPTCTDGIKNGDEVFVDCGGSCGPCGTCSDGILNNDEEEIDCGGSCAPCQNCFDGIQNYGETDIDCGGHCGPCATCSDGIQNQEETGVDCGGPCSACNEVELPVFIEETKNILSNLLLGIIIAVVAALLVYKFYHKQAVEVLSRAGWYLTRKTRKQILFSEEKKVHFLRLLDSMNSTEELTLFARKLITSAFGIPFESNSNDVVRAVKTNHDALKKIFLSLFGKVTQLETDKEYQVDEALFVEELRQIIFQTSLIEKTDLVQDASEVEVKGAPLDRVKAAHYNALLALQFEELEAAKKHYLSATEEYQKLSEAEKTAVLPDLQRLYQEIRYQLSWK